MYSCALHSGLRLRSVLYTRRGRQSDAYRRVRESKMLYSGRHRLSHFLRDKNETLYVCVFAMNSDSSSVVLLASAEVWGERTRNIQNRLGVSHEITRNFAPPRYKRMYNKNIRKRTSSPAGYRSERTLRVRRIKMQYRTNSV